MCFIGLIGKEQLPCCISTIFLSSTALAGSLCSHRCPRCAILSAEDEERASVHVFVCACVAIIERCELELNEHRRIDAKQLSKIHRECEGNVPMVVSAKSGSVCACVCMCVFASRHASWYLTVKLLLSLVKRRDDPGYSFESDNTEGSCNVFYLLSIPPYTTPSIPSFFNSPPSHLPPSPARVALCRSPSV